MKLHILLLAAILALTGCRSPQHSILAASGTAIGLEVAENPASQLYHAKLGYVRSELAVVPSNRTSTDYGTSTGNGAKDTGNVVMELHYGNIFSLKSSSIYQRLAVGDIAVAQPGAAYMFAKNTDGTLDPATARAVSDSIKGVPSSNPQVTANKVPLAQSFMNVANKADWDNVAKAQGYASFNAFLIDSKTTQATVDAMAKGLRDAGLIQ